MAIEQRNYDPAIMYGANKNITVDLGDVLDSNGNEILEFDAVDSAVNFVRVANSATGNAPVLSAQGDDTNVGFDITTKGTGGVTVTAGSSGVVVDAASANGLSVGANGSTNPVLKVDSATSSVATGISITGAAAAGGVALAAISSGTNEDLTVDAKGSGTITLGGTSTGNIIVSRTLASSQGITSSSATAGIGYATGAGGAVTQATNRTTGVTLNKITGAITTDSTSLAAGASASFTVTNSAVAIGDVVVSSIRSGATTDQTNVRITAVAAGSFDITVENNHASTAETGAIVINFAVIKAVGA